MASGTRLPYTAVGFPRVFYLRYHGYRLFFPLLALARYRNLLEGTIAGSLRFLSHSAHPLRGGTGAAATAP